MSQPDLFQVPPSSPSPLEHARREYESAVAALEMAMREVEMCDPVFRGAQDAVLAAARERTMTARLAVEELERKAVQP